MTKHELKVKPIENGTVIDHIPANKALQVLKILGLPKEGTNVTLAMNVHSKLGFKDIVKFENRELGPTEIDKIALIAPDATINIIRDFEIVSKDQVRLVHLWFLLYVVGADIIRPIKSKLSRNMILVESYS